MQVYILVGALVVILVALLVWGAVRYGKTKQTLKLEAALNEEVRDILSETREVENDIKDMSDDDLNSEL